jgi:hypothetical protein
VVRTDRGDDVVGRWTQVQLRRLEMRVAEHPLHVGKRHLRVAGTGNKRCSKCVE